MNKQKTLENIVYSIMNPDEHIPSFIFSLNIWQVIILMCWVYCTS